MSKLQYPALITEQAVTVYKPGRTLMAHSMHPNFVRIVDAVRNHRFANIERLFAIAETLEKCFNVEIRNGSQVFYKGKVVHNVLTDKILLAMRTGTPVKPWIKFLNNLMENPSDYCRDQLFSYVEHYGLPIDSNGFVYAWKAVTNKFLDKHTEKISYSPGREVKMKREDCEQNPTVACGSGLHSGATDYVLNFGSGDDRFVLIKFNPRDAVSCPADSDWKKIRACKVRVVREVKREEIQPMGDNYIGAVKKKKKK